MAGLKTALAAPPNPNPLSAVDRPSGKPKRVTAKIRRVIQLLLDGEAKTIKAACDRVGCSPDYAGRELRKPHVRAYIDERTVGALSEAKTIAAARLVGLIHADSEHVSFDARKHTLAIGGIAPPSDGRGLNINVNNNGLVAGYIVDLATPWYPVGSEPAAAIAAQDDGRSAAPLHVEQPVNEDRALAMRPGMSAPRLIEHDHATGQRVDKGPVDPNSIRPVGRGSP